MVETMNKFYTENIDRVDQSIDNLDEELNDLNGLEQNVHGQIPQAELKGLKNTVDVKVPETINYTVKKGDTLSSIIKNKVLPYYSKLSKADKENWTLIKKISEEIEKQNNVKAAALKEGQTLTIKTANITKIVNEYLNSAGGGNKETTNEKLPEKINYTVKKGDTLSDIVKNKVLPYYSKLSKADKENWTLIKKISEEIEKQNNVKAAALKEGQTLTIKTANITKIVNEYLNSAGGGNKETTNEKLPEKINYTVKKGDTLSDIVKNKVLPYYSKLSKADKGNWSLIKKISEEIERQNNVKAATLKEGQTLTISTSNITKIVNDYLKNNGSDNGGNSNEKINNNGNIEVIGGRKYIALKTLSDFRNGKDLINRLYSSPAARPSIEKALKEGQKILIPAYTENKNSKILKLEDIIKPEKIIDNKLKGKTFEIDPGHGFNDSGAVGLARYGDAKQKTKIAVFESAIGMDIAYRTAKILKAHGAKVEFTHYIPTRGISNQKDLAPCFQYVEGTGKDKKVYNQDKRTDRQGNTTGNVSQSTSVITRKDMTNKDKPDMFVSFHMDSISPDKRSSSVLVDVSDPKLAKSRKFADYLASEGVGKVAERGHTDKKNTGHKSVCVLRMSNCPSVLLEMGNIQNTEDAYVFRNPTSRQQKAEQIAAAMVKYKR